MGTRIVVMKDGEIQQVGTPKEIYDNSCKYVCCWIYRKSAMNFFRGKLT